MCYYYINKDLPTSLPQLTAFPNLSMGSPKPTVENLWITKGIIYEKIINLFFDCSY